MIVDLTGQRFGRLLAIERIYVKYKRTKYKCVCDCGKPTIVEGTNLVRGKTRSCGCYEIECRESRYVDLTGRKFGKLLVLKKNMIGKKSKYDCLCDCGNKTSVLGESLQSGGTTSCGCNHHLEYGLAAKNLLFGDYRRHAKRRGMIFDLAFKDFISLCEKKCVYCGKSPSQIIGVNPKHGLFTYNGIDRVDNSKGYDLSNCATCCKICNNMKHTMSKMDFLNHIKNIYENSFI